jgi:sugar phosphate isomerase/epimerase
MWLTEASFHPSLGGAAGPTEWPAQLRLAAAAGFDAIDIDLWQLSGQSAGAVVELLAEAGLRPGGAALPVEFRQDEDTFRRDLEKLPARAGLAARVGVAAMSRSIPASGPSPASEAIPVLRRRLTACARVLDAHGVGLALEMLGPLHLRRHGSHELIWRLADGAELADSCGPGVGVLVDAWHWHHAGEGPSDIADLGARILHVHVADAPDLPPEAIDDKRRLLPGEGVIDFGRFVDGLARAGYRGQATVEVHGYGCRSSDPVDCARRARAAVMETLASGGGGGGGGGDHPALHVRGRAPSTPSAVSPAVARDRSRSWRTSPWRAGTAHTSMTRPAGATSTPSPATASPRSAIAIRTGSRRSSPRPDA